MAALSGRELSVVVRNRRLLKSYFAARGLDAPSWITLHAELEVDHFLDLARPLLTPQGVEALLPDVIRLGMERTIGRHVEYLDALLREQKEQPLGIPS